MIIRIRLAGLFAVGLFVVGVFAIGLNAGQAVAHSGGTNGQGCHAGSQPYHCH
jgi:hypothetical protein